MKHRITAVLSCLALSGASLALDIESAREMDLDGLRGLGPATTRQILHERERAPFRDWTDLQRRVRGLGPQTAARLSAQGLRVQGQAYSPGRPHRANPPVNPQADPPAAQPDAGPDQGRP